MGEEDILNVLEIVTKSVVHINTLRVVQDYYYRRMPIKGMGSGFIVDSDGHIVTNAHVVRGADRIGVVLHDSSLVEGVIKGSCQSIDVALIKVDSADLTAAELGDSDKLRVGQRVYAIGNPFGLVGGPTVTSGVVSALNRSIQDRRVSLQNLVQTDAPINPGNSGGPLVDTRGNVVAMNTAIIPYAQGIGFAIPINPVKECVEQVKVYGQYATPWVGIYGVSTTPQIAEYYNLMADRGVLVTNVIAGSPAQKSNITAGDVIVALDGVDLNTVEELRTEIERRRIGETARLLIIRGRQRGYVDLKIEGRP